MSRFVLLTTTVAALLLACALTTPDGASAAPTGKCSLTLPFLLTGAWSGGGSYDIGPGARGDCSDVTTTDGSAVGAAAYGMSSHGSWSAVNCSFATPGAWSLTGTLSGTSATGAPFSYAMTVKSGLGQPSQM